MRLDELRFAFWFDRDRAGAAPAEIENTEQAIGRRLPRELKEALRVRDGGVSAFSGYQRDDFY
ncbi:MAG: hypothetical protein AB7S26_36860, partial [Sandaracinaceae bacterium]